MSFFDVIFLILFQCAANSLLLYTFPTQTTIDSSEYTKYVTLFLKSSTYQSVLLSGIAEVGANTTTLASTLSKFKQGSCDCTNAYFFTALTNYFTLNCPTTYPTSPTSIATHCTNLKTWLTTCYYPKTS